MEKSMTWGKHPRYANNQWIKLAYGSDKAEYRYRESLGFTLRTVPIGTHPNKNPYPTRKGFGLRLYHAAKAIRKLGRDPYADIYTRGFDNCFENNDGSAVVWALMHEATQEPDDDNPLTRGIQTMFKSSLDGQRYPQCWLDTYNGKDMSEPLAQQLSLF